MTSARDERSRNVAESRWLEKTCPGQPGVARAIVTVLAHSRRVCGAGASSAQDKPKDRRHARYDSVERSRNLTDNRQVRKICPRQPLSIMGVTAGRLWIPASPPRPGADGMTGFKTQAARPHKGVTLARAPVHGRASLERSGKAGHPREGGGPWANKRAAMPQDEPGMSFGFMSLANEGSFRRADLVETAGTHRGTA